MTEPCPEFAIINDENVLICKNGKTNYWLMNMEDNVALQGTHLELNESFQTTNVDQQSQQLYYKQQKQESRLLIKWKE